LNCSYNGNTITVIGAITSNLYIKQVDLAVGNILNPLPAKTTGSFFGTIGIDRSVPN
jgi:hypothetical protein